MSVAYGHYDPAGREKHIRDTGFAAVHRALNRPAKAGKMDPHTAKKLHGWSPTRNTPMGYRACTIGGVFFSDLHKTTAAEYVREFLNTDTGIIETTTYTFTWKDGEYLELEAPRTERRF